MKKPMALVSAIIVCIFLFEAGCISSDDPEKRKKRALAGGTTSTALGIATGVGGPVLAARAALGAASRVVTGDAVDAVKDQDEHESDQPVQDATKDTDANSAD